MDFLEKLSVKLNHYLGIYIKTDCLETQLIIIYLNKNYSLRLIFYILGICLYFKNIAYNTITK